MGWTIVQPTSERAENIENIEIADNYRKYRNRRNRRNREFLVRGLPAEERLRESYPQGKL